MTAEETPDAKRPNRDIYDPDMLALSDPVHRRLLTRLADGPTTADALADMTGLELSEVQRGLEHLVEIRLVVQRREGAGHEMFYTLAPRARFTRSGEFTLIDIRGEGGNFRQIQIRVRTREWM